MVGGVCYRDLMPYLRPISSARSSGCTASRRACAAARWWCLSFISKPELGAASCAAARLMPFGDRARA